MHVFAQCRLGFSGPSNLSKVADLQSPSTSLFGRKISAMDLPLPTDTQGSFLSCTGELLPFDRVRYWKPDVQPSEMDQLPQLLKYQAYISRMHAA